MLKTAKTDIAIFGGGIAGLWLLNQVTQLGFSAVLLESDKLGGGQTLKSQGIIHGGTKYALHGEQTNASQIIAAMPGIWQECLKGKGEIDLTGVPVLSPVQYLFSTNKFTGKLAGFFASLALQGKVNQLPFDEFPKVFQHKKFKGLVYALNEMAIDVSVLIQELSKPQQKNIFKINSFSKADLQLDSENNLKPFVITSDNGGQVILDAQKYIFTAGAGNEILSFLENKIVAMQRRALHMVLVKTDFDFNVFAHCLGLSGLPRITITTHKSKDGKLVWYLGGQIAEEGVERTSEEQIQYAKKELSLLFPWLDFSKATYASFFVDRAEPLQPGGKRPDTCFFQALQNVVVAWPTKLALAPKLSQQILQYLNQSNLSKNSSVNNAFKDFTQPEIAKPMWDILL